MELSRVWAGRKQAEAKAPIPRFTQKMKIINRYRFRQAGRKITHKTEQREIKYRD